MIKKVSINDLQLALTPNMVRVSQILYFSIMMGATVFFLFVVYLFQKGPGTGEVTERSVDAMNRFSLIHAVLFAGAVILSQYLYGWLLREQRIETAMGRVKLPENANVAYGYLALVRSAKIIRIAIFEMPVFFGIVTCFMGVTNRAVYQQPLYWLNALSYLVLMIALIKDFPTKEKIMGMFKDRLKFLLQY